MKIVDLNGTGCTLEVFHQNDGDIMVVTESKESRHTIRIGNVGSGHRRPMSVLKAFVLLAKEFEKYEDCESEVDAERKEYYEQQNKTIKL